jgi:hypothetical protein
MSRAAPTTIPIAAKRLRKAESRVLVLRAMLAAIDPTAADHRPTLTRLKACERALYNRRLELEALQRERRRAVIARVLPEAAPAPVPAVAAGAYSSGSVVNISG